MPGALDFAFEFAGMRARRRRGRADGSKFRDGARGDAGFAARSCRARRRPRGAVALRFADLAGSRFDSQGRFSRDGGPGGRLSRSGPRGRSAGQKCRGRARLRPQSRYRSGRARS